MAKKLPPSPLAASHPQDIGKPQAADDSTSNPPPSVSVESLVAEFPVSLGEAIVLFLRMGASTDIKGYGSLKEIAAQLQVPVSGLSKAIAELEEFTGQTLVNRAKREGVTGLTEAGVEYRARFERFLQAANDLKQPMAQTRATVRIMTTNAIRQRLLWWPVAAHVRRRQNAQLAPVLYRIEEDNYPGIARALRFSHVEFAVSWNFPENFSDDIESVPLIENVGVAVLFPPEDLLDSSSPLHEVLAEDDEQVRLKDLLAVQPKVVLITIRTEHLPQLAELVSTARLADTHYVNHSEDVLSHIRMGLGFGWAPEWYRERANVQVRMLVDDVEEHFVEKKTQTVGTRTVLRPVVRHICYHRKKEAPPLSPEAESLRKTIFEFFRDSTDAKMHTKAALGRQAKQSEEVKLETVVAWADKNPL